MSIGAELGCKHTIKKFRRFNGVWTP